MHKNVIGFVNNALESGLAVALAILTDSGRDTPGVPGAMLALCSDGSRAGTVGGGGIEAKIVENCAEALRSPDTTVFSFDYSLREGGGLDMVCGGQVKGFVTVMRPEKRLIVFGGGHVGRKVCEAGLVAGFAVTVIEDNREDEPFPGNVEAVFADDFGAVARDMRLTCDCYVVVATRGHAQDYAVLFEIIEREWAYLGMIGSSKKVAGLRLKLRERGVPEDVIGRIHTPIGMDIDNGTPGEIAIAVIAEILAVKNRRDVLRHCRERSGVTGV